MGGQHHVAAPVAHEAAIDRVLRAENLADANGRYRINAAALGEMLLIEDPLNALAVDETDLAIASHVGDERFLNPFADAVVVLPAGPDRVVVERENGHDWPCVGLCTSDRRRGEDRANGEDSNERRRRIHHGLLLWSVSDARRAMTSLRQRR